MSYTRILCRPSESNFFDSEQSDSGASGRNRTNDTRIFSPLLYLLSYRGMLSRFDSAQNTQMRIYLATPNGLEPSTSSVTGWRANRLHHRARFGGNNRARTCDLLLVRQMLSQLSYAPVLAFGALTSATWFIIHKGCPFVKNFFRFFLNNFSTNEPRDFPPYFCHFQTSSRSLPISSGVKA